MERLYKPTDLPKVIETYTASIRTLAAPYYPSEQIAAWAPMNPDVGHWQRRLAPLHTWVMEQNEVIAGFASYTLEGYLDFLYTHPAFARQGVASQLYQRVASALCESQVPRISTHASLAARPFFDHHGFAVDAEECVECRGVSLRRFAMHRPLSGSPA